jgi:two-component system CheB/CheR fusion protein
MKRRSDPPRSPEALRAEIIGLGTRSLRKSYFGQLQKNLADLARFRALLDVAADAIVVAELPHHRIVDVNRAGHAFLGAPEIVPEGRPLASFFSPPVWRRLERVLRHGARPGRGAERLVLRVGGRGGRELEVASREESFGAKRYLLLVARDVTEQRRAARALAQAKEEAEGLARLKAEFLSVASHELRTPLTALQLRLQKSLRSGKADAASAEGLLAPVRRLTVIVNDLLEVSRLDRGRQRLDRSHGDVRAVVSQAVEALEAAASARRIALADGPSVLAVFDHARVARVVTNLLENAMKFSPEDSPVEVRVWGDARAAHVAVADRGPGIAEEERGRLFTPFSRLQGTITIPGLGLGLYVSRQIARMHGGDVVASHTPGGGATLTLWIPRAEVDCPSHDAARARLDPARTHRR